MNFHASRVSSRRGFTLLELLVVTAIVMILAGLMLAAIRPVRATAQRTQCAQNLRQLSTGLFAYAADHDNNLPPVLLAWPSNAGQENTWGWLVWPYIYNGKLPSYPLNDIQMQRSIYPNVRPNAFRCPATRDAVIYIGSIKSGLSGRMSYGLNNTPLAQDPWNYRTTPIPLSRITRPAQAAMVLEASYAEANFGTYRDNVGLVPHQNGANILFYDGHVEWRTATAILQANSTDVFWTGN